MGSIAEEKFLHSVYGIQEVFAETIGQQATDISLVNLGSKREGRVLQLSERIAEAVRSSQKTVQWIDCEPSKNPSELSGLVFVFSDMQPTFDAKELFPSLDSLEGRPELKKQVWDTIKGYIAQI